MTYLAVSLANNDLRSLESSIGTAAQQGAEMVELRLDGLEQLTCQAAMQAVQTAKGYGIPVIATCRHKEEGGLKATTLDSQLAILKASIQAGADYIDCEAKLFASASVRNALLPILKAHPRCRIILSAHRFKEPFDDLEIAFETIKSIYSPAIVKLVYFANQITDCFAALDLQRQVSQDGIIFCMGQAGTITRLLAKKLNGFLTFACLDAHQATAAGQIPIEQLKHRYGWDRINANTELYGLIGFPVAHSIGPAVFNAVFAQMGLNAVYLPFLVAADAEYFYQFVDGMISRRYLNVGGFSVTLPHKTNAMDFVNRKGEFIDAVSRQIGAVNTIKIGYHGIPTGYNTDYIGALNALTEALSISSEQLVDKKVAVLGAGGVARAIVAGLCHCGADITIYNRTVRRAEQLANAFGCRVAPLDQIVHDTPEIIINCTSVGMAPDSEGCPIDPAAIKPHMTVFDTVYNPLQTKLLRYAQQVGAKTVNGLEMYVRQALEQFKIFFGFTPDVSLLRQLAMEALSHKQTS